MYSYSFFIVLLHFIIPACRPNSPEVARTKYKLIRPHLIHGYSTRGPPGCIMVPVAAYVNYIYICTYVDKHTYILANYIAIKAVSCTTYSEFLMVRPVNQPTVTVVGLWKQKNGHPWSIFMFTGRNTRGKKKLLKVELEFHPMQTCNDSLTRQQDPGELRRVLSVGLLDDSMLCVGVLAGGRDSCQVRSDTACCSRDPLYLSKLKLDQSVQKSTKDTG